MDTLPSDFDRRPSSVISSGPSPEGAEPQLAVTEPNQGPAGTDQAPDGPDDAPFTPCSDHDHFDIPVVDVVLDLDVDVLFELLFTKHPFYYNFQSVKKSSRVDISDWSEPDDQGEKSRNIEYIIAINNSVGPKSANTSEKQVVRNYSKVGRCYVVDSDCYTYGIPYSESFYLVNRFCMNRLGPRSSQLRITSKIVYNKKVWGLIKSFIEKNVKSGTVESYVLLAQLLKEHASNQSNSLPTLEPVVRKKKLTKRRRTSQTSSGERSRRREKSGGHGSYSGHTRTQRHSEGTRAKSQAISTYMVSIDHLAKGVLVLLLVLSLLNAALYYTLTDLEDKLARLTQLKSQ